MLWNALVVLGGVVGLISVVIVVVGSYGVSLHVQQELDRHEDY